MVHLEGLLPNTIMFTVKKFIRIELLYKKEEENQKRKKHYQTFVQDNSFLVQHQKLVMKKVTTSLMLGLHRALNDV